MIKALCILLLIFVLSACQNTVAAQPPATVPLVPTVASTEGNVVDFVLQSKELLPAEEAGAPLRLAAPSINLAASIEAMGWRVAQVEGERKAVWEVPEQSVGWHLNSARPGTAGNLVFSGHHLLGSAVFAPLARGELNLDAPLLVTDDQGRTFLYRVSEIADPLPAIGGTGEEQQRAAAYVAPTQEAVITLITGWPDFSDTHYLFIRGLYVGQVE